MVTIEVISGMDFVGQHFGNCTYQGLCLPWLESCSWAALEDVQVLVLRAAALFPKIQCFANAYTVLNDVLPVGQLQLSAKSDNWWEGRNEIKVWERLFTLKVSTQWIWNRNNEACEESIWTRMEDTVWMQSESLGARPSPNRRKWSPARTKGNQRQKVETHFA